MTKKCKRNPSKGGVSAASVRGNAGPDNNGKEKKGNTALTNNTANKNMGAK
ncbi:hypothetical protein GCM10020331_028140 [Ectobacillus funiculus]